MGMWVGDLTISKGYYCFASRHSFVLMTACGEDVTLRDVMHVSDPGAGEVMRNTPTPEDSTSCMSPRGATLYAVTRGCITRFPRASRYKFNIAAPVVKFDRTSSTVLMNAIHNFGGNNVPLYNDNTGTVALGPENSH